jgi:hypothetical protein
MIENREVLFAGLVSQGAGEPAFADAVACMKLVDAGIFCQFVPNLSAQAGLFPSIQAFRDRN